MNSTIPVMLEPPASGNHVIHVGYGLAEAFARDLCRQPVGERYALVTDDTVAGLHGDRLCTSLRRQGLTVDLLTFPAGEAHKTRDTVSDLLDRLVALPMGRDGALLALGGGVVGDLAGFAAAIYQRGIPFVQLPTTLLAMVDASIGGKTGHDLPGGKNLVGAFHQPAAVYADLALLDTLPRQERRNGFAEVVKHAAIADARLLSELESTAPQLLDLEPPQLERVVLSSMRIKVEVIGEDAREAGRRAILNFGHTVAHAVEHASNYGIPHGEAVAIGMVAEAVLSAQRGLLDPQVVDRLARLLQSFELPVRVPAGLEPEDLWDACTRDKKVRKGAVHCVLLQDVGVVARPEEGWAFAVHKQEMLQALGQLEA
jgi:3-dehydroquinate synthase